MYFTIFHLIVGKIYKHVIGMGTRHLKLAFWLFLLYVGLICLSYKYSLFIY